MPTYRLTRYFHHEVAEVVDHPLLTGGQESAREDKVRKVSIGKGEGMKILTCSTRAGLHDSCDRWRTRATGRKRCEHAWHNNAAAVRGGRGQCTRAPDVLD